MRDLESFLEKETNKRICLLEYNNQDLKPNQELITFNNSIYVIEVNDKKILNNVNGYFYLIYQINLEFSILKNVLENLYEDIDIISYDKFIIINSNCKLDIDENTVSIIESETYSNSYIFDLGKINKVDKFNSKINIINDLIPILGNNNPTNKFISTNDLILYQSMILFSKNKSICNLIDYEKIKTIDDSLLYTGLKYIESGLNISKTSSSLFIHRNTLIYRLDKIKELLDLDLKNYKDSMIFYLSIKSCFLNQNI